MEAICSVCLCDGRKLYFIGDTGFHNLYTQILNEIPTNPHCRQVYDMSQVCVRVCWECKSLLRRFHQFKRQVKSAYSCLLKCSEQLSPPQPLKPHLQIQHIMSITYPDHAVKRETPHEEVEIKSEQDVEHCEPETFVHNLERPRRKRRADCDQTEKEKSKKKVKNSKKSKFKKKIKVEKRKRQASDASSDVSVGRQSPASESHLDGEATAEGETELKAEAPVQSSPQHLRPQNQHITDLTYPEQLVKREVPHEDLEVNSEQELEHCEPETFVHNLERPRRKRRADCDQTEKEKSKKKVKNSKKSKFKKKIKVEKRKRQASDASSDVSVGRQSPASESHLDGEVAEGEKTDPKEAPVQEVQKANGVVARARKDELPDKPQCVECGKMFSSRKTYRYHLNVLHKGQNRYPCPRCGKVYQWKSNLGRHMRSHKARDSGELYCETCDKRFASVATYRQHLRVSRQHVTESEFSFMCNECGKKFVNKTRLRDHIDWEHLKKIKFRCQLCNKPFKCHTSLYVHMQNVHRNKEKKDNLCHVCGKSYQNGAKLKYHIVAMHTSETPYQCAQCSAAFGWYSSLYRHVREVHYKMKVQPKKTKKVKKLGSELLPSLVPPQLLGMQPGPA